MIELEREPDRGGLRAGVEGPPLAEAKLAAPSQRAGIVHRPRILRALDAGEGSTLTLVAAPPGYGKSTAVRDWVASRDTAYAWVTLDEGDSDPVRLWRYVTTAIGRVLPGVPHPVQRRLSVTGAPIEAAIDELANGITIAKRELVIVLDDVQKVTDLDCLASLEYCLSRLPASARLVLITRVDPPLKLAALSARGELAELRADELAFTADEARQTLLGGAGSSSTRTKSRRWSSGPRAGRLRSSWPRSGCARSTTWRSRVQRFGADQRFIADYLSHEVLSSLDDELRRFLLQVSVLGRFTPDAVRRGARPLRLGGRAGRARASDAVHQSARAWKLVPRPLAVRGLRHPAAGGDRARRAASRSIAAQRPGCSARNAGRGRRACGGGAVTKD